MDLTSDLLRYTGVKENKENRLGSCCTFAFAFLLRLSWKKSDRSVVLKIDALTDRKTFPTNGVAYSPGKLRGYAEENQAH